ncbi:sulfite oxidase-like oxidoreductase [Planctomicrobium sp. SH661]|uniref:sulfite oxidase-like oxidoreductase n=1 Tax=Planctomicrobium sp. SH661 TaxID=3448124 RepID=UPI003F5C565E
MHDDPKYQSGSPPDANTVGPGVIISADTLRDVRIPPGQVRTRKWPVLHAGGVPEIDLDRWQFRLHGLVQNPLTFTLAEFQKLPRVQVFADFHCVTHWSRLGNLWEGVSVQWLLDQAGVDPAARYVVATGYDEEWSTNLPLADFNVQDALLADRHDGVPLDPDHGGPVRLIIPRLYAWKSAKWIRSIELIAEDRAGFWEQEGYHMHGDPWVVNDNNQDGERFRDDAGWSRGRPLGAVDSWGEE